jgi:hypothetical protein
MVLLGSLRRIFLSIQTGSRNEEINHGDMEITEKHGGKISLCTFRALCASVVQKKS